MDSRETFLEEDAAYKTHLWSTRDGKPVSLLITPKGNDNLERDDPAQLELCRSDVLRFLAIMDEKKME